MQYQEVRRLVLVARANTLTSHLTLTGNHHIISLDHEVWSVLVCVARATHTNTDHTSWSKDIMWWLPVRVRCEVSVFARATNTNRLTSWYCMS